MSAALPLLCVLLPAMPLQDKPEPEPDPVSEELLAPDPEDSHEATALQPLALTVSGGVSLGAYMAGFVYLTTELVKRPESRFRLVLATGASAGSANALVAALNACGPPNPDPMKDLGWKAWSRADYRSLFVQESVTPTSLFTRNVLNQGINDMAAVFSAGLPEDCDTVVGFSATRVEPYEVELAPGFSIPRLAEKFAFRIQGRGMGRVPRLSNYIDPYSSVEQPLLPLKDDSESARRENFERLRSVLLASGAFPFAFAPQDVEHCLSDPAPEDGVMGSLQCEGERVRSDPFIDGGVFDNTPLQFAYSLADLGLLGAKWSNVGDGTPRTDMADQVDYLYLDPGLSVYPPFEDEEEERQSSLLPLASEVAGSWILAARSRELYALIRERETLSKHMRLTRSHYPPASSPIGAFLGFFDRKFRHFDFYLGMYDAAKFFSVWSKKMGQTVRFENLLPRGKIEKNWEPFACMVGYYEPGYEDWRRHCNEASLHDFRILLQVSLDRIYAHCSTLEDPPVDSPHYHCARAARKESVPRLVTLPASGYGRTEGETHFHHNLRLLEEYGFWFEDLNLTREQAALGRVKLRRKLLGMA
ncbi:MAG: patatin-like phospholipase family protein, partial [Myxococcota bacterium]